MREFRIYKPTRTQAGTALKIQCVNKIKMGGKFPQYMLFLEVASQLKEKNEQGNDKFDWRSQENPNSKSATMKLDPVDVAEILLVLNGYREEAKLFHDRRTLRTEETKSAKSTGNTMLSFKKHDGKLYLRLSTGKDTAYNIGVSANEAIQLKLLLERFILLYYGWV